MRTLRIVLTLLIALAIVAPLAAQEEKKEKGKSKRTQQPGYAFVMMERLREAVDKLDLTAEQKEKLQKIRDDQGPKMKEAFGKLGEALTEEQKTAAGEAMKAAKAAGKKGREAIDSVQAAVKLTDEQKKKMAEVETELAKILRGTRKEIQGILTTEQREKFNELMPSGGSGRGKGKKKAE